MKKKVLLVQRSDIVAITAKRSSFESYEFYSYDVGLLSDAAAVGLHPLVHVKVPKREDFQAKINTRALALSKLIDIELSSIREELWPGYYLGGWDIGVLYHAMFRFEVAEYVAREIGKLTPESFYFEVLRPKKTQHLYFDCRLVSSIFTSHSSRAFSEGVDYDQNRLRKDSAYSRVIDEDDLSRRQKKTGRIVVSHVPTCFYDVDWIRGHLTKNFDDVQDLASDYWDVPISIDRVKLRELSQLSGPEIEVASTYAERIRPRLTDLLKDKFSFSREDLQEQIDCWSKRSRWQALNFMVLSRAGISKNTTFLIADQDVGLNGPLYSVAAKTNSSVIVMPHSGFCSMRLPHNINVRAIEQTGFNSKVKTVLDQPVPVQATSIRNNFPKRFRSSLKNVWILLNNIQFDGLSFVDTDRLAFVIKRFSTICRDTGVSFHIRSKPGSHCLNVVSNIIDQDHSKLLCDVHKPLGEVVEACDLCIGYGEPTSALLPFIESESLVIQVSDANLSSDMTNAIPGLLEADRPVSHHTLESALLLIHRLARDPQHYRRLIDYQTGYFCGVTKNSIDAQDIFSVSQIGYIE